MKVAVSVPDSIFEAAERLAKQRDLPRSQIFAEALSEYLSRHGSASVTAKLNEVYSNEESAVEPALAKAQAASVDHETW